MNSFCTKILRLAVERDYIAPSLFSHFSIFNKLYQIIKNWRKLITFCCVQCFRFSLNFIQWLLQFCFNVVFLFLCFMVREVILIFRYLIIFIFLNKYFKKENYRCWFDIDSGKETKTLKTKHKEKVKYMRLYCYGFVTLVLF